MKRPLVAGLVVVLFVGAGAYLFSQASSPAISSSLSNDTRTSLSSSFNTIPIPQTQSTQRTTYQIMAATAQISVSVVNCNVNQGTCTITLVNAGGTSVGATGCTLNGQAGVFGPAPGNVPPGGSVDISCAPAKGGAIPIPGFHVEGLIQQSDGSSVSYIGRWA